MAEGSDPVSFAVVGTGWRAEFYRRLALSMPDRFRVTSVRTRSADRIGDLEDRWGCRVTTQLDEVPGIGEPEFGVVAVPPQEAKAVMIHLVAAGMPVLCETPPAVSPADLEELSDAAAAGTKIQVAEQFQFQPMHAARLALLRSGVLGTPQFAEVSAAHGYHAISLLRAYLGIDDRQTVEIGGFADDTSVIESGDRVRPPGRDVVASTRYFAYLRWGNRLGVYLFDHGQYFSLVRPPRVIVEAARGTIVNHQVTYADVEGRRQIGALIREERGRDGDLWDSGLEYISFAGEIVYANPFVGRPMSDEEIAVATAVERMGSYVRSTGPGPYPLAEAIEDQRLALRMASAW